ncbi:MAG TPA: hypothetical protein VF183_14730, partial [Acidimicrobiales bacterium]
MNRTSLLAGAGVLGATAIAVLAGIVIGDATNDAATVGAPPIDETVPPGVLVAADRLTAVDADGNPVDAAVANGNVSFDVGPDGAALVPVGIFAPAANPGALPARSPESEAFRAVAEDVAARAAAIESGEAEPEPYEPATEVVDDSPSTYTPRPDEGVRDGRGDAPVFIDLCAGEADGDRPADADCPTGVGGTIIALNTDPVAELGIELKLLQIAVGSNALARDHGPDQVAWGYCDFSGLGAGEVPVWVLASKPIDAVLEHGRPGSPTGTVEVSTPTERLENIALMTEGLTDIELARRFAQAQVCGAVPQPDGGQLELTITARDAGGDEVSHTMVVPVSGGEVDMREPTPRPTGPAPTPPPPPKREASILGSEDYPYQARIIAPQDDPRVERVYLASIKVNGDESESTETCGSIQQSVFDGSRREHRILNQEVVRRFVIPDFNPFDDLPLPGREPEVDPNEGLEYETVAWFNGEDGAVYDVCVWWTGNPTTGSTFATPPIIEQRRYRVEAPDYYRVTVTLEDLRIWDDVEANQFTVEVLGQHATFPTTDLSMRSDGDGSVPNSLEVPIPIAAANHPDTPERSEIVIT